MTLDPLVLVVDDLAPNVRLLEAVLSPVADCASIDAMPGWWNAPRPISISLELESQ